MDKLNRSINDRAITAISEILDNTDDLGVDVVTAKGGATIIDAGVKSEGSFEIGCYLTEICMGSLGKATLGLSNYGDLTLPVVFVETSRPSEALLGSQFAGWKIDVDGYFAMASGPGRALSLKPKKIAYNSSFIIY